MNNVEQVQYLSLRGGHALSHHVNHDLLILASPLDVALGKLSESLNRLDLLPEEFNQALLIVETYLYEEFNELLVTFPGIQLVEEVQVNQPLLMSESLSNDVRELRVGTLDPPTLAHSIGQCNNPLGVHVVEISEDQGAKDVSVLHGHTVDLVACQEAQARHPNVHGGIFAAHLDYAHP